MLYRLTRIGALAVAVVTGLPLAAAAQAGASLDGPAVLAPGERATYRATVAGDPEAPVCDAGLEVELPPGFQIVRAQPNLASVDRRTGRISFAAIERLEPGEQVSFDLEVEAPLTATSGQLCARLRYGLCPSPRSRDLELGPSCRPIRVATPSYLDDAPSLPPGADIPCGSRPTVQFSDYHFEPTEWADAATDLLPTMPGVELLTKTNDADLFVALRIADTISTPGDWVTLFVNANADDGNPEAVDRAYLVTRAGGSQAFSGQASGYNLPVTSSRQWEVAEEVGGWVVELQIPLSEILGPADGQRIKLAVQVQDASAPSIWPATFDTVDETTMEVRFIRYCASGGCSLLTWAQQPDVLSPANEYLEDWRLYDDIAGPNGSLAQGTFQGGKHEVRVTGFSNGGSTGNVLGVEVLIHLYVVSSVDDSLDVEVYRGGARISNRSVPASVLNTHIGPANVGDVVIPLGRDGDPWSLADFAAGGDLDIRIQGRKIGGWDGIDFYVDAIGFRVQVDGVCSQPSGQPDVFLQKDDGYANVTPDQLLTYQLQYGNRGNATGTTVSITDQIPPLTTYVAGTGGITAPSVTVGERWFSTDGVAWSQIEPPTGTAGLWLRWIVPVLPPAGPQTWTAAYQVRVAPNAVPGVDRILNDAVAVLDQTDADTGNNWDADDGPTAGDDAGDQVSDFVFPAITVPCLPALPVVDGAVSATEYQDANLVQALRTNPLEAVKIYLGHDFNYLYVGFDIDDDEANNSDSVRVTIDVNNNKLDPDAPDRQFEMLRANQRRQFEGRGDNTDGLIWSNPGATPALMQWLDRPGGWTAEMAIPLGEIGGVGAGDVVGIAFFTYSASGGSPHDANNPAFATLTSASSWTNAHLLDCPPVADFTYVAACPGQPIQFTDASGNNPSSWLWTFEPGQTSTDRNPSYAYATGGTRNVTLETCNATGCDTVTLPVGVYGEPVPNFDPTAPWLYQNCVDPAVMSSIPLDGRSSTPGTGASIVSYGWTATSGTFSTVVGPNATLDVGGDVSVDVTLQVIDSHGCQAEIVKTLDLFAEPAAALVVPAGQCGDSSAIGAIPLDASGTTFGAGATPAVWAWSVPTGSITGSGATVTWEVPAATYGLQNVRLEVIDDRGCAAGAQATVDLFEPPVADLVVPPQVCSDRQQPFSFPVDASGSTPGRGSIPGAGYTWSTTLGSLGGSTGATETISFAAGQSGVADVCVQVDDSLACSDSICRTVVIDPAPIADFTYTLSSSCADPTAPIVVDLDASVSSSGVGIADPSGYAWTSSHLGLAAADGRLNQLILAPGTVGTVSVSLTVTDGNGCPHSVIHQFEIHPGATADIQAVSQVCTDPAAPITVPLDGSASSSVAGIADPAGYVWSVPPPATLSRFDGSTTDLMVPAGFVGTVTVTLTVTDGVGCASVMTHDVEVTPLPIADLAIDPVETCRDPNLALTFDLDATGSSSPAGIADPSGYAWSTTAGTLSSTSGGQVTVSVPPDYFGSFDVTVDVTDLNGCSAALTEPVVVREGPRIAQPIQPAEVCADASAAQVVALAGSATSPDGIVRLEWTTTVPSVTITPTGIGTADLTIPAGYSGVCRSPSKPRTAPGASPSPAPA